MKNCNSDADRDSKCIRHTFLSFHYSCVTFWLGWMWNFPFCICRPKDIQEIILVSPMGVSKLMDLLGDSREVIRNDVSWERFQIVAFAFLKPCETVCLSTGPVMRISNQGWDKLHNSLHYDKNGYVALQQSHSYLHFIFHCYTCHPTYKFGKGMSCSFMSEFSSRKLLTYC